MSKNEEDEETETTFDDAVLKELSLIKDLILKDDYLTDVITKAVGGSALTTSQEELATLVKGISKQLTTMQETQSGLVKSMALLQKELPDEEEIPVPEEEKQVDEEEIPVPEEEKQVEDEEKIPEVPPEEKVPEEEKQVDEETVPEEEVLEEEKQVPEKEEEEEDFSKMVTADTPWEKIHNIASKVRPY